MSPTPERWLVLGMGRVGCAMAQVLADHGVLHAAWARRGALWSGESVCGVLDSPALDIPSAVTHVLLTVPDDRIQPVLRSFPSAAARVDLCWVHASGARQLSSLTPLTVGTVAVCHPLVSFAGEPGDVARMQDAFFAIDGTSEPALRAVEGLARACGGAPAVVRDDQRVAYHLASVLASNGVYALLHAVDEVLRAGSLDAPGLTGGLTRLAVQSARSAEARGVVAAATGPVVRGDVGTVERHLAWAEAHASSILPLVRELSERLLALAEARGSGTASQRAAIHALLWGDGGGRG